jgi:DNA polymerase I-like protein with 3'-5' exonuclease and polymerase domains
MIHPAAALRMYDYTYLIIRTLQRVREEARFPEIKLTERELLVDPTFHQALRFLEEIYTAKKTTGFDIENTKGKSGIITCLSFANTPHRAMCIPFADEMLRKVWDESEERALWSHIRDILEDEEIRILAHNAGHEYEWLYFKHGIKISNLHDTMIMQRIAQPDFPSSLGFCCSWYKIENYYKEEDDAYLSGEEDITAYWRYNAKDSAVLIDLEPELWKELEYIGNTEAYQQTVQLIPILAEMQFTGINTDLEGIKRERKAGKESWQKMFAELEDEIPTAPIRGKQYRILTRNGERVVKARRDCLTAAGELSITKLRNKYPEDTFEAHKTTQICKDYEAGRIWCVDTILDPKFPNSDDQKKRFYYEYLGYKPYKSRKKSAKDKRRIDEYAMRKLGQKGAPGAKLINEMAKIDKLVSTYYDPSKVHSDGRLHCRFYVGPKTGRLASSKGMLGGMNLQNQPQSSKKLLIADD